MKRRGDILSGDPVDIAIEEIFMQKVIELSQTGRQNHTLDQLKIAIANSVRQSPLKEVNAQFKWANKHGRLTDLWNNLSFHVFFILPRFCDSIFHPLACHC